MPAYFPNFYDDELLASAVARYHCHTMGFSNEDTHRKLYNRNQQRTAVNFPRNLGNLHANIGMYTGKTLDGIVANTTLFPYYYAFEPDAIREKVARGMVGSSCDKGTPFVTSRSHVFSRLRACPDCIKADIEKLGEAYWHRTHQIDVVHVCPIHGVLLLNAQTRYFESPYFPLEILTPTTPLSEYLPRMSEKCRQRLTEIADYAHGCLNGASVNDGSLAFGEEGRSYLRKLYPSRKEKALAMAQLEKDILEHFGEQCLDILELPIRPGHRAAWLRGMFKGDIRLATTKHIIMKIFIDDFARHRASQIVKRHDVLTRLSVRKWPCYNPAADHFGQEVVSELYKSKGFSRNGLIGFRCDCGYIYLIKESDWNGESAPISKTVLSFGSVFVEKVRSLYADGLNHTEIGRHLGFNPETAKSMLSDDYRTRKRRAKSEAIAIRRQRAIKWKLANPTVRAKVDFAARDDEFSQLVREAADAIYHTVPPARASRSRIIKTSRIKDSQLIRKHLYPKTLATLDEVSETADYFRIRIGAWRQQRSDHELVSTL